MLPMEFNGLAAKQRKERAVQLLQQVGLTSNEISSPDASAVANSNESRLPEHLQISPS